MNIFSPDIPYLYNVHQLTIKCLFLTTDPPEFSEHPQNGTVLEGLNVAFSCNASGNPSPKFSWTKNGSPINITDNARISLSQDNKQLNITNVNRVDSGEYKCVANNSVGAVNSSTAFLTVQCKNTFTYLLAPNCVLVRVHHAARFSFQYLPIYKHNKIPFS